MNEATLSSHAYVAKHEFKTIQALRFIAAFAVVVLHSSFYTAERLDDSLGIYAIGANGVRLFFVISGFVMVVSSRALLDQSRGWSVFAMKRVVRIVPMYWLITTIKLLTLLLVPAVVLHAHLDWDYIVKSYLFVPVRNADGQLHPLLGVGWTLVFEMFFYALFTMALLLRLRPLALLAPIMIALSFASMFRSEAWPVSLQFWCDPIVLDFLAGMLIASWLLSGSGIRTGFAAMALAVGLAFLFIPSPRFHYLSLAGSLTTTLASSLVVIGCIALEKFLAPLIPRWTLFLGAASYATYLIHPIVSPAVPHVFSKLGVELPVLAILLSVAIALLAGSIFHVYFEKPVTNFLNSSLKRHGLFNPGRKQAAI